MRSKLLAVLFLAVLAFLALNFLAGQKSNDNFYIYESAGNGYFKAEIIGSPFEIQPAGSSKPGGLVGLGTTTISVKFPAISQRDKNQYNSEEEWRTWSPSSCSAAAITSVLVGYGKNVRITDVLSYLKDWNAITARAGLHRYDVFSKMAELNGLRAVYSENKNLDSHLESVLGYLRQGYPVILNVYDPQYFPGGHFVVGTGINSDGTILIMNSDPASGKSVYQNWPLDGLKQYFTRTPRSAAILPA